MTLPLSEKKDWKDQPNYAVSRLLLRLVLKIVEKSQIEAALSHAFSQLSEVSAPEQNILFDMLDASISFVSTGDQAILSNSAFAL